MANFKFFGFEFKRTSKDEVPVKSFADPTADDGSLIINDLGAGAFSATSSIDFSRTPKNEGALITRYRDMATQPEAEVAIDDIINEAITYIDTGPIVEINLDELKELDVSDKIKDSIREEFDNIYNLFDFQQQAYEIFRRWYVDGRMFYHVVIDNDNPQKGILELRYVDPRKIKKITELENVKTGQAIIKKIKDVYFLFNENFMSHAHNAPAQGLRIGKDSVVAVTSGLMRDNIVVSHLDKAIKPLNQLRILEDSTVIYRITRAPERRIFYIDVGNLPKAKAEQYLRDMMVKHKNKLIYNSTTGEIKDDPKQMTMLEDFWLPRREGGRGTEISTLPAGTNLGEIEDVLYFQKKLYKSLNVPFSRLDTENGGFNLGRPAEITRDEIKFSKFVNRLRLRFSMLFMDTLEKQLVLKGVLTQKDWKEYKSRIRFQFIDDSHFAEIKEAEILRERINTLREVEEFIGRFFSNNWVRRHVLQQSEGEIKEMDKEIEDEAKEAEKAGENIDGDFDADGDVDAVDSTASDSPAPGAGGADGPSKAPKPPKAPKGPTGPGTGTPKPKEE